MSTPQPLRPSPVAGSPGGARDLAHSDLAHSELSHLDRLEAESIHIFREVAAEFRNPVLLYSIGKDSTVLLHLMKKAFAPARSPG